MKTEFTKAWIIEHAVPIIETYEKGILTIRGLHYRLVSIGMINDISHYKKVVTSMISARWDGIVEFDAFVDNERAMVGSTESEETILEDKVATGKHAIKYYMENYHKNRWENQPYYPEVFIEKKALQGVFESICTIYDVGLGACKGYPSLTFLNESADRFREAVGQGKKPVILYFGDYDPSGEDIPRSINDNIVRLDVEEIEVRRFALMKEQVIEWNLPPAPIKVGDSRSAAWDGLGQVELDAIEPKELQKLCESAIESVFDNVLYDELLKQEDSEKREYQMEIKDYVDEL